MMKKRFQEYDLKWEEACDMAKNRNEWRKFVKQTLNLVFILHNVNNLRKMFRIIIKVPRQPKQDSDYNVIIQNFI